MPDNNLKKAVFVDRDCTIIEDMVFSIDPADIRPLPGAVDALKRLQEAGYLLVVITNQSGVARGRFDEAGLEAFHAQMVGRFKEMGVRLAGAYYCPHYPGEKVEKYAIECDCRKPRPGMLLRAAEEHGIDLKQSWMVGDRPADIGAGKPPAAAPCASSPARRPSLRTPRRIPQSRAWPRRRRLSWTPDALPGVSGLRGNSDCGRHLR